MTMPKQIDVEVTKPQNKHGQWKNRKCPVAFASAENIVASFECLAENTSL